MTKKYGDIDWLALSGAERVGPTKALYRAFVAIAEGQGKSVDLLLDDALGTVQERGTDYASNFRAGKISKIKARDIHLWLAKTHFDEVQAIAANLFPYKPKDAFQDLIDQRAVTGKLRVIKITEEMGLVERADTKRRPVQTLRLGDKFCFELDTAINGVALAFQGYQGKWHPLPLGADERRMKADVEAGANYLPKTVDGKPIALDENDDTGNHQFVVIASKDRAMPQGMAELAGRALESREMEVHVASVRFVG